AARFDDAGSAHAGGATRRRGARHDPRLEPAHGVGAFSRGVGKGPGATARIPLATGRALGRVSRSYRKACVVAARPVEADLRSAPPPAQPPPAPGAPPPRRQP